MKKIIVGVLSLVFLSLLYFNFIYEGKSSIQNNEVVEDNEETTNTSESSTSSETKEDNEEQKEKTSEPLVFNEDVIQEKYDENYKNNEPLIIDVVLPTYYSDSFINELEKTFNSNSIQFNRIDIDVNSMELSQLDVHENSDIVILSALQIQDYNNEVLPDHDLQNVLDMYMSLLEDEKIAVVLSEVNVYDHINLENTIYDDQTYMTDYDYFYVDNSDLNLDNMYDNENNTLTKEAETEVSKNIQQFFIQ